MRVRDIMSQPPQICSPQTDLATASGRMKDGAAGMLVVLDSHGRIAGVVTDRDLALSLSGSHGDVRKSSVEHAMTQRVHTCHEDDDLHLALAEMASKRIRRLPVSQQRWRRAGGHLDRRHHLVGGAARRHHAEGARIRPAPHLRAACSSGRT
jgi:signal-transduction protein with cAMP-binding, CBS, and nucleotidyltransferase domain